jgi:hypothetical protein
VHQTDFSISRFSVTAEFTPPKHAKQCEIGIEEDFVIQLLDEHGSVGQYLG